MSAALLSIRGLEAGYAGSQVLFGVDLEVGRGEVVSLMGRNGMGKTTTRW
jgi:branched-chain amino acid transport system ATP-binding protein